MPERLTGMDSSFLSLETPQMPQHVMGVMILDTAGMAGGYSFDLFRKILLDRIHLMGPLRKRFVEVPLGLDHGVWVDDSTFDLDEHLHHVQLSAPASQRDLEAFVGEVAAPVLDRSRPLWDMWVVEGLEGDRVAVVTKMHHSTMDGATGADLMAHLFDLAPEPRDVDEADEPFTGEDQPNPLLLLASGLGNQLTTPGRLIRQVARTTGNLVGAVQTSRKRRRSTTLPLTAPRVPWSGALSTQRSVAFTTMSLDDVKAVKDRHGGKVNDVLLAVTAQALREYLLFLDELPGKPLVASVPISVRAEGSDARNQIATMFAPLPVQIEDPLEQVTSIVEATATSKELASAMGNTMIMEWSELTAPTVIKAFASLYSGLRLGSLHPPMHNAVVSNVQGPPLELYVAGGKVEAVYPMGPLLPGAGINITCLSNMGNIDVGILADAATVPEVWRVAEAMPAALRRLLTA